MLGSVEETQEFYASDHWFAIRGDKAYVKKAYKNQSCYSREVSRGRQREVISLIKITQTVAGFYGCEERSILLLDCVYLA